MNFEKLAFRIQQANEFLQQNAVKAINIHITLRNWLTAFYIVEFKQNGSDRAEYGAELLENLAKYISIRGLSAPDSPAARSFITLSANFRTADPKIQKPASGYFLKDFDLENIPANSWVGNPKITDCVEK